MKNFVDISFYKELYQVQENWKKIRDEGILVVDDFMDLIDNRSKGWKVAPIKIEKTDRRYVSDKLFKEEIDKNRDKLISKFPFTCNLLDSIETVDNYMFSLLEAGHLIEEHRHKKDRVTAILPLTCGNPTYISVNDEKRYMEEGKFVLFNYSSKHKVINDSDVDRLALLILMPLKKNMNEWAGQKGYDK